MSLTYRLFDSIDDIDLAAWERVHSECGAPIFMDPRFVGAVEISMRQSYRFWHVIVYENGRPVACACLTAMTIDLADFADPQVASIVRRLPRVLARFRNLKVFLCGLPGLPADKALAVSSPASRPQILSVLDGLICDLAARERSDGIIYKEFGSDDLEWMNPLLKLGYRRVPTPPMHFFRPTFNDFSHYCEALKTRYRQQINRSTRKLSQAGVNLSILTDPEEIVRLYTSEVHDLYHQMVAKAEMKLEVLPIEFFHQLTLRLSGEIELIVYSKNSKAIAFGWCLHAGPSYHMLYAGLNYQFNSEFDLYFNLHYAALDRAMRKGVSKIYVGQSANAFKARIGCYSEPMYAFTKGLGPFMSRVVRYGATFLVAQTPPMPPSNIFKSHIGKLR
jgi:predicted N-acyltransferase